MQGGKKKEKKKTTIEGLNFNWEKVSLKARLKKKKKAEDISSVGNQQRVGWFNSGQYLANRSQEETASSK